jgi:hypothetical protein
MLQYGYLSVDWIHPAHGENQLRLLLNIVIIHIAVFWDVVQCSLIDGYKGLLS